MTAASQHLLGLSSASPHRSASQFGIPENRPQFPSQYFQYAHRQLLLADRKPAAHSTLRERLPPVLSTRQGHRDHLSSSLSKHLLLCSNFRPCCRRTSGPMSSRQQLEGTEATKLQCRRSEMIST